MMGRWRSGAPLALCPFHDDPQLGADPQRNNAFMFEEDDKAGLKTPGGSHIRRTNPRDASIAGVARIHRMIRRGTA
jgi:deferrochelatase/peroxidase EfeB